MCCGARRNSTCSLPHRAVSFSSGAALARRTSRHCTGVSTCPSSRRSIASSTDIPVVSISDAQRDPLPEAGWVATVTTDCRAPAGIPSGARAAISPSSAASPRRSGSIGPSRSRPPAAAVANCRQGRSRGSRPTSRARSALCSTTRWWSSSAKSAKSQKAEFLGGARRCSFRLTGPSRSGWS